MPDHSDIALLADDSLILRVDARVDAAVRPWIPRRRTVPRGDWTERASAPSDRALLTVGAATSNGGPAPHTLIGERSTLVLGGVAAIVAADRATLRGPAGISGNVDLVALRASIVLDATAAAPHEVHGALTLASALLLGRMRRALVHAACVVDPRGRGWLLVGDSHSGKTTTCASLVAAGWRYVADDQVVLRETSTGLVADGWPRDAHLDRGWHSGEITRTRVAADLSDVRPDAWVDHAPACGAWFTTVDADRPTTTARIAAADALGRVIRQSPWLLADPAVAAESLELLSRAASLPCWALSLGRDSYAKGEVLAGVLDRAIDAS